MKQVFLSTLMVFFYVCVSAQTSNSTKKQLFFNHLDKDIQTQLGLSDEQKSKLLEIRNEIIYPEIKAMNASNLAGEELRLKKQEINIKTRKLYNDVLTPEQKKKANAIVAEMKKQNKANGF